MRSAGIKWKEAENGLKSELFWCFIVLYPPLQCHHQRAARSRGSSRWWCNAHGLGHCRKKDRKFIYNKINNAHFLSRITPGCPSSTGEDFYIFCQIAAIKMLLLVPWKYKIFRNISYHHSEILKTKIKNTSVSVLLHSPLLSILTVVKFWIKSGIFH